ncbi:cupin domain-containing protein [Catellatospora sp. NPDC049609]|uniref:cupin domain-containing protein n=1 Tax=Catellatospora sp. NPDC049609 TaxID=3155505 RepID=UPI00344682BF
MTVMRVSGVLAAGLATAALAWAAPTTERPAEHVPPAVATARQVPEETVRLLLQQPLPNVEGKTFSSAIVDFPPSARAVPHRHGEAFVYAYVLDGTMRSQLEGEPVRTYREGENWVESPGAHHVLTENTSSTEPAKLLVIFVSNTGDELKLAD